MLIITLLFCNLAIAKKTVWKETTTSLTEFLQMEEYKVIDVTVLQVTDSNSMYNEKIIYSIRGPKEFIICHVWQKSFELTSPACYYEDYE